MINDIAIEILSNGGFGNRLDLAVTGTGLTQDLATETGLRTAVLISIFTEGLCDETEVAPGQSRRGWWGDMFAVNLGDTIGSKLWLLDRSKNTDDVLVRAEGYCGDALQWLVDDNIAKSVGVVASFPVSNTLLLEITITRPDGKIVNFEFATAWNVELTR